ncbi:MAG: HD domain-containing phosphohydrolase [Thermodesulfobacteriota bacterium]
MTSGTSTPELIAEVEDLRKRLAEAEETLRAIRSGEVDALVVTGVQGEQVYTLSGADRIYRHLIETMSESAATLSADGDILYCNARLANTLRRPLDKVLGTALWSHLPPGDRNGLDAVLRQAGTEPIRREIRLKTSEGRLVTVYLSATCLQGDGGERVFCLVFTDLIEQKRFEEIVAAEQLARLILEQAAEAIVVCDDQGRIIRSNQEAQQFCLENPLRQLFSEAFPLRSDRTPFSLASALQGVILKNIEVEMELKGQSFALLLNAGPLFTIQQQILGCVVTLTDITERKQMEESLRKSEENFRRSLDDSPLGVSIVTSDGETIYANQAILDIYGYDSVEELKRIPLKERYTPESYAEFEIRKGKRERGEFGPSEYAVSIVRKNGKVRHVQVFRKEIFWNSVRQFQIIYRDITELKEAEGKLQDTLKSLRNSVSMTIQAMVSAVEIRDPYTAGHQIQSANLARAIATEMGLPRMKIDAIRIAGSIHDIGKLSIPAEILSKPKKLSEIEFSLIKGHAQKGYEILKNVESPWPLAEMVYQHHERMDGSGYPRGLKGEEILMEARILAVADVVEAMASHRPYRPALGIDAAMEEIEKNKGVLYDRDVAETCLRLFRDKGFQIES